MDFKVIYPQNFIIILNQQNILSWRKLSVIQILFDFVATPSRLYNRSPRGGGESS